MSDLLARRKRNVQLRFEGDPPPLEGVAGVSNLQRAERQLVCRVDGDLRPFLAAISGTPIVDLTIESARLEEAFLEFYEKADPS
jgi:hypothetical protein